MLNKVFIINIFLIIIGSVSYYRANSSGNQVFVPVGVTNRHSTKEIKLTNIGSFGLLRKARSAIPAHFHTGIDIQRPRMNYQDEPIYPIAKGIVLSKKTNGPFAQLMIEHKIDGKVFWSLYEHCAGIIVNISDSVDPEIPIARFMTKSELNKYGWQFDHIHIELLKIKPLPAEPDKINPKRYFSSYSLICYSEKDLQKYYYDPLSFIKKYCNE